MCLETIWRWSPWIDSYWGQGPKEFPGFKILSYSDPSFHTAPNSFVITHCPIQVSLNKILNPKVTVLSFCLLNRREGRNSNAHCFGHKRLDSVLLCTFLNSTHSQKWWCPFYIKMTKHKHSENINLPVFQYRNSFDDLWWSKNQFPSIDEVRVKQWVIYTGGGRGFLWGNFKKMHAHTHYDDSMITHCLALLDYLYNIYSLTFTWDSTDLN